MNDMRKCAAKDCEVQFPAGVGKAAKKKFCSDPCRYRGYRSDIKKQLQELRTAVDNAKTLLEKAEKARVRL